MGAGSLPSVVFHLLSSVSLCKKKAHIPQTCRLSVGLPGEPVIPDILGLYFSSGPTGQAQVRWSLLCSEGAAEEVHLKEQRGTRTQEWSLLPCYLIPSLGWLPKMVPSPRGPVGTAQKVQLAHRTLTFLKEDRPSHLPRSLLEDEKVFTFQSLTGSTDGPALCPL